MRMGQAGAGSNLGRQIPPRREGGLSPHLSERNGVLRGSEGHTGSVGQGEWVTGEGMQAGRQGMVWVWVVPGTGHGVGQGPRHSLQQFQ
jgi:hypothetical protein